MVVVTNHIVTILSFILQGSCSEWRELRKLNRKDIHRDPETVQILLGELSIALSNIITKVCCENGVL
jgi:hypothetical protein